MVLCSFNGSSTRERISWALSYNSNRSIFNVDALANFLADLGLGIIFSRRWLSDLVESVRVFSGKNVISSAIFLSRESDLWRIESPLVIGFFLRLLMLDLLWDNYYFMETASRMGWMISGVFDLYGVLVNWVIAVTFTFFTGITIFCLDDVLR